MAFLDILKGRKREEVKPERLPKGAFSPKANRSLAEKRPAFAKPARSSGGATAGKAEKSTKKRVEIIAPKEKKATQSLLAAEFLLRPHITEQSNLLAEKNIYTFQVSSRANKPIIKKAIKEMYGFEPIKIRIISVPSKKRIVAGKTGIKPGFKKALVYLKSGDKIEFI
jgi:large subunit ribosomal protein L23